MQHPDQATPRLDALARRREELTTRLQQLRWRVGDDSPDAHALQRELRQLDQQIRLIAGMN